MIIISGTVGVKIVGNNQHQPDLLLLASISVSVPTNYQDCLGSHRKYLRCPASFQGGLRSTDSKKKQFGAFLAALRKLVSQPAELL